MLKCVFTLASFSFWTSSCIFFFSFSNSVMIRTWFILVSSKACKCDSVGFILFKFYSGLPCYKKVKDDARDEKKTGEGRGKDNRSPPPLFFIPYFLFVMVYQFFIRAFSFPFNTSLLNHNCKYFITTIYHLLYVNCIYLNGFYFSFSTL